MKQECIPVRCVPSAAVAFGGRGVCRGGVSAQGGMSAQRVSCLPRGWVVCLGGGMSAQRVGCLPRHLPPREQNQTGKTGHEEDVRLDFSRSDIVTVSYTKCPSWKSFIGCTSNHTEPPALSANSSMNCSYFSRWSLSWDGQKKMKRRRITAGGDARLIGRCVILCVSARSASLSRR